MFYDSNVGDRDSSVGIATRYGLDGPGIESRWGGGEIFRTRPDRPWGAPSLLDNWYRVSFPGVKRPGRDVNHRPTFSAEVKYTPLWAFMGSSRANFTFTLAFFVISHSVPLLPLIVLSFRLALNFLHFLVPENR